MKYADKVKTPTLFVQGDRDYRCWLAEAVQMFTALKYHGVETRMCMVYGENHSIALKPLDRITDLTETMNWFRKFLQEV